MQYQEYSNSTTYHPGDRLLFNGRVLQVREKEYSFRKPIKCITGIYPATRFGSQFYDDVTSEDQYFAFAEYLIEEAKNKEQPMTTPAEIIKQAKAKAEKAIMEVCSGEISRICNSFSCDTGIPVDSVRFEFVDVSTFGGPRESVLSGCDISIDTNF